ncbi:pseudouridine synthase [Metamycoplasma subdolum]|uniref:Pseudouridine synthase n=1 Tax=Metamycoplasma subdolum TaxID=92407 RepID=A0A3M0AH51_9BACT|nr:pseudouridine synthase [Metamycoplasma subdolum]RMA78562.1 pseudouridine synthase [Metamycoplasma subdolum]WPB50299.1 pseudouridine synthase [Metamycoplasma subdolum]
MEKDEELVRIQKLISELGYSSRREAEKLILAKKVKVDGILAQIGQKVLRTCKIEINGKELKNFVKPIYIVLNKPAKTICSLKDPEKRKTIYDHIRIKDYCYSIGRLDWDTTGIILITNDGKLASFLSHPSSEIERKYLVKTDESLTLDEIMFLNSNKVILEGKKSTQKIVCVGQNNYEVILKEGRNHHVKKLFELVNKPVKTLHRKSFSFISDKGLKVGEFRNLTNDEIRRLKNLKIIKKSA